LVNVEHSQVDDNVLQSALEQAHIPALAASLVHLTGDIAYLKRLGRPAYGRITDNQGGLALEDQRRVRLDAFDVLRSYFSGKLVPSPLDDATIQFMMNFVAGADIPNHYLPMMLEELGSAEGDVRRVDWGTSAAARQGRKLHVIVVGAGMSGLLMALRLHQAGISFEIIEKNSDVGGTWLENRYPGCRVDAPNLLYSYSFEPNHEWQSEYPTQDAVLAYFRKFAAQHQLNENIRFNTTASEFVYDELQNKWKVHIGQPDGSREVLSADYVVSSVGQLNEPKFPDIDGLKSFSGPVFHSALWPSNPALSNQKVAIIGTGATAFQLAPAIADEVAKLSVFQRSAPWLVPTPNYYFEVSEAKRWLLKNVPYYGKWYRFRLFWKVTDSVYESVKVDPGWCGPKTAVSANNLRLREGLVREIVRQCGESQDLLAKVVPDYPFGGKRAVLDNGVWVQTLRKAHVNLVTEAIKRITPHGILTSDNVEHPADVIICATGFHASEFLRRVEVIGRNGKNLRAEWNGNARAYLGMTVPNFPNFFMMYGPNTNLVVNGSLFLFAECSARYIVDCIKLAESNGSRFIEVRPEVYNVYNESVDRANRAMAWGTSDARSWYKNKHGRVTQNWPFPIIDYWNATRYAKAEDFFLSAGSDRSFCA
jgi:4-hydroxyacetophenone monooxygenase